MTILKPPNAFLGRLPLHWNQVGSACHAVSWPGPNCSTGTGSQFERWTINLFRHSLKQLHSSTQRTQLKSVHVVYLTIHHYCRTTFILNHLKPTKGKQIILSNSCMHTSLRNVCIPCVSSVVLYGWAHLSAWSVVFAAQLVNTGASHSPCPNKEKDGTNSKEKFQVTMEMAHNGASRLMSWQRLQWWHQ